MGRVGQRLDDAEVVEARQQFADRHGLRAPRLADHGVLGVEGLALVGTGHGVERAALRCRPKGRARTSRILLGQTQRIGQERHMPDLPQVVQARDRQRIAHQPSGQVRRHRLPVAGQQHRGQMPARRVTGHGDARGITAIGGDMAPCPGQGPHHLQHDRRDRHRGDLGAGAQRVVGQHHASAALDERRRHEGMIALVERAPPTAVDEEEHRRVGRGAGEDVEGLARCIAIADVEHAGRDGAGLRRVARPACKVLAALGHAGTVVVHALEPSGVIGRHEFELLQRRG
jgi:hypothetical protein